MPGKIKALWYLCIIIIVVGFIALAAKAGLFPHEIMHVKGNKNAPFKRSYMAFGFEKTRCLHRELTIETARHQYTPEYIELVKDFYLKM